MMVGQGHYFELWDAGVWSAKLGQALAGRPRRPRDRGLFAVSARRMHEPVLAREAIEALAIRPDGVYVDGTFGRGGHSG